jgi:hypothetical protein
MLVGPVLAAFALALPVVEFGCAICAVGHLVYTSTRAPASPDLQIVEIEPQLQEIVANALEVDPDIHALAIAALNTLHEARLNETGAATTRAFDQTVAAPAEKSALERTNTRFSSKSYLPGLQ